MGLVLPKFLHQYFWGDRLNELSWKDHQKYIIQTVLEKGDRQAASWLLKTAGRQSLRHQLKTLSLSPKSANFWRLYLS